MSTVEPSGVLSQYREMASDIRIGGPVTVDAETPAPTIEARFKSAALYSDAKGYIWQRLRNGLWRSTDGCTDNVTPRWADQPADERWAPYTRVEAVRLPLDFVHALVTPPAEQQDRKAAALAVIEDLRRQLDEAQSVIRRAFEAGDDAWAVVATAVGKGVGA